MERAPFVLIRSGEIISHIISYDRPPLLTLFDMIKADNTKGMQRRRLVKRLLLALEVAKAAAVE